MFGRFINLNNFHTDPSRFKTLNEFHQTQSRFYKVKSNKTKFCMNKPFGIISFHRKSSHTIALSHQRPCRRVLLRSDFFGGVYNVVVALSSSYRPPRGV